MQRSAIPQATSLVFRGVSGGKGEDDTVQYLVVLSQNEAVLDGTGSALGSSGWDMVIMGHLAR